jgi:hypothetical protein
MALVDFQGKQLLLRIGFCNGYYQNYVNGGDYVLEANLKAAKIGAWNNGSKVHQAEH